LGVRLLGLGNPKNSTPYTSLAIWWGKTRHIGEAYIGNELLLIAGEKTTIVNEFLESKGLYGVDSVAKTLAIKGMGRNNLYDYLRQNKIIMTDTYLDKHDKKKAGAKHYEAYSQYVNQQQYFAHRSRTVQAGFKTIEQLVAMFTPKGIEWIIKRLQKDGYIPTKDLKTIIEELTPVV
jgi:phage antirepressor YoqD-like protein